MSASQAASLAVALMLSACNRGASLPQTSADAAQLRWLDHADVAADFRERVEQHDMRFVSVYAFSTPTAFGLGNTRTLTLAAAGDDLVFLGKDFY